MRLSAVPSFLAPRAVARITCCRTGSLNPVQHHPEVQVPCLLIKGPAPGGLASLSLQQDSRVRYGQ